MPASFKLRTNAVRAHALIDVPYLLYRAHCTGHEVMESANLKSKYLKCMAMYFKYNVLEVLHHVCIACACLHGLRSDGDDECRERDGEDDGRSDILQSALARAQMRITRRDSHRMAGVASVASTEKMARSGAKWGE